MKKLLIALAAVFITASSYGQGQIVFVNRVTGVFDAPVYIEGTTTPAGTLGAGLTANLYSGDTLLGTSNFRATSGTQAAYFFPATITIDGNNGTEITDLNIRFMLDGVLVGQSDLFSATPGVSPNPPTNIGGYPSGIESVAGSLTVVPEPTTIALGLLGAGALLLRRRRK